jgi:hypothetical protein
MISGLQHLLLQVLQPTASTQPRYCARSAIWAVLQFAVLCWPAAVPVRPKRGEGRPDTLGFFQKIKQAQSNRPRQQRVRVVAAGQWH